MKRLIIVVAALLAFTAAAQAEQKDGVFKARWDYRIVEFYPDAVLSLQEGDSFVLPTPEGANAYTVSDALDFAGLKVYRARLGYIIDSDGWFFAGALGSGDLNLFCNAAGACGGSGVTRDAAGDITQVIEVNPLNVTGNLIMVRTVKQ